MCLSPQVRGEHSAVMRDIRAEVAQVPDIEKLGYLSASTRDGHFSARHNTWRISQADLRWITVLKILIESLGGRAWIYREGMRSVWVVETTFPISPRYECVSPQANRGFVRGYFDAEGGIPRAPDARFYIQFAQKNFEDLLALKFKLTALGIRCGELHNPSFAVDPNHWRVYVCGESHADFASRVSSWHPRKRGILEMRYPSPDQS